MPAIKKIKGRYEVKAVLGEGGMGVVYRAYDPPPMNREVALKTLLEFPDQMSLQLFYKECEVLKSLAHPNIVEIYDIGEFEDVGRKKPFFVMPLLRGQTLDELIRKESHRLSVDRVVEIIAQTCRGLQAAHDRNLVHRDLKPSNLWVLDDDSVKIIDFGVAYTMDARTRSSGFQKGTLLYMAPEQILFKPLSPQSDIFSLGVVCYEALTRRQPFRGTTEDTVVNSILKHIPPPASEINPAVNQAISRVVHKAMAKQPWNRFDTAREFGETLQKALRNQPIELFDPARIKPRITRAAKALETGDYQFADEIVAELEAEGNLDPELTLLRTQIDQVVRQKTIAQLQESARARYEEDEDPLALQKIQEILQLDQNNVFALGLKSKIENRRNERQVEKWLRLAVQHIDSHSYSHAREALKNVLQLKPNEPKALRLLSDVEGQEKEYLRLRQRKAQVYQSALNAWKNKEVSQALADMGMVLELDRQAPDTSSPETSSQFQQFYNQVRSEHDAINAGYAEASRALADADYAKALKLCQEFLTKYPNLALFQALNFDVEEQQRQQLSAFIADVNRRLEAERDLETKVNLLREAAGRYPDEPHFQRSLRSATDKRDLVNGILARARAHEQQNQFSEAINDLETLRAIYSLYPGLQFEIERVQKRREQQAREEVKTSRIEQINRQIETGNYARATELAQKAIVEFPNDAELTQLEAAAGDSWERSKQAEHLLAQGNDLCARGNLAEGVEVLRQAYQLDRLNPVIIAAFRDALVDRARITLELDPRAADEFAKQALELDPGHALAKNIRAQVKDRERDEALAGHTSKIRRLEAAGDLQAALAEADLGLKDYPSEPNLTSHRNRLSKELGEEQKKARSRDMQDVRALYSEAGTSADTDKLKSILERTQSYAGKYPDEPELQTINREIQRIILRREGKPTPKPKPAPKPTPHHSAKTPSPNLLDKLRPLAKGRPLQVALGAVGLLVVVLIAWRFWPARTVQPPSPTTFAIELRTTPVGAAIRINGVDKGTSTHFDLLTGDYQIEASLPGYVTVKSSFSVGEGKPSTLDLPPLQPLPPALRVATDLDKGDVFLDDQQVGSLADGAFDVATVAAGQHALRIAGAQHGQDATISFQAAADAVTLSPVLQTHQLQVVVVSAAGGNVQVVSSLGAVPVTVDQQPNNPLTPDGLQLSGLSLGSHELALGAGKDLRIVPFDIGPAPTLQVRVFSDRDVGTLIVESTEDGAQVFLDDREYKRKIVHGQLRINLPPKQYRVRVHKDGFDDSALQVVDIVKGQDKKVPFVLVLHRSSVATLQLEQLAPGTQISIDRQMVGSVGSDGSFSFANVQPGEHELEFALPGNEIKPLQIKFTAGQTQILRVGDLTITSVKGELDVMAGRDESWTILQGERKAFSFTGSQKIPLEEGSYTVRVKERPDTPILINAGKTSYLDLRRTTTGMELFDAPWQKQDNWYVHNGGDFVLYNSSTEVGTFVFSLRVKHSSNPFARPKERWVIGYLDRHNYILFELDNKSLDRTVVVNGNKQPPIKTQHKVTAEAVVIQVTVSPEKLTHSYSVSNGGWQLLDTYDLTDRTLQNKPKISDGKFGFYLPAQDAIEISNFQFSPKQ